jgi:hypothetical protein
MRMVRHYGPCIAGRARLGDYFTKSLFKIRLIGIVSEGIVTINAPHSNVMKETRRINPCFSRHNQI